MRTATCAGDIRRLGTRPGVCGKTTKISSGAAPQKPVRLHAKMELPGDLVAKLLFKVAFSRHEAYNVLGACCPQIPALAMEAVRFETRAVEADLKMCFAKLGGTWQR